MIGADRKRRAFWERLSARLRYGTLTMEALSCLQRATGLVICPYYIFRGFVDSQEPLQAKVDGLVCRRLRTEDLDDVARLLEPDPKRRAAKAAKLAAQLATSVGFGAFVDGVIVGYCWAELEALRIPKVDVPLFDLARNEASACDFFVAPALRGKRIGPVLRQTMYEHLARDGRDCTFRSISVFNKPSLRVVAKSTAEKLETRLRIGFPALLIADMRLRSGKARTRAKPLVVVRGGKPMPGRPSVPRAAPDRTV